MASEVGEGSMVRESYAHIQAIVDKFMGHLIGHLIPVRNDIEAVVLECLTTALEKRSDLEKQGQFCWFELRSQEPGVRGGLYAFENYQDLYAFVLTFLHFDEDPSYLAKRDSHLEFGPYTFSFKRNKEVYMEALIASIASAYPLAKFVDEDQASA